MPDFITWNDCVWSFLVKQYWNVLRKCQKSLKKNDKNHSTVFNWCICPTCSRQMTLTSYCSATHTYKERINANNFTIISPIARNQVSKVWNQRWTSHVSFEQCKSSIVVRKLSNVIRNKQLLTCQRDKIITKWCLIKIGFLMWKMKCGF